MWDDVAPLTPSPPVDRAQFEREIYAAGEPVLLKGQVADWPIVRLNGATEREFCDHLASRANAKPAQLWAAPPTIDGRYGFSPDFSAENFDRKLAPVADICALLLRALDEPAPPAMFAGAVNLDDHLPALLPEVPMALLQPDRHRLTSLWIGNRSRTTLHWDLPDNLSCVVRGQRHYLLFPPDQIANLYLGPIDRTLAGQSTSMVDCDSPDFVRFPRYAQALAVARQVKLDPGDALFIPSMWFHQVVSQAPIGAQINFWWRANDATTLSPLSTLTHALLTLRDLPANERQAWRAFFDHYIFGDPLAAISHLPPGAAGMLGPMTPERELQLSEQLVTELVGWHNQRLKQAR